MSSSGHQKLSGTGDSNSSLKNGIVDFHLVGSGLVTSCLSDGLFGLQKRLGTSLDLSGGLEELPGGSVKDIKAFMFIRLFLLDKRVEELLQLIDRGGELVEFAHDRLGVVRVVVDGLEELLELFSLGLDRGDERGLHGGIISDVVDDALAVGELLRHCARKTLDGRQEISMSTVESSCPHIGHCLTHGLDSLGHVIRTSRRVSDVFFISKALEGVLEDTRGARDFPQELFLLFLLVLHLDLLQMVLEIIRSHDLLLEGDTEHLVLLFLLGELRLEELHLSLELLVLEGEHVELLVVLLQELRCSIEGRGLLLLGSELLLHLLLLDELLLLQLSLLLFKTGLFLALLLKKLLLAFELALEFLLLPLGLGGGRVVTGGRGRVSSRALALCLELGHETSHDDLVIRSRDEVVEFTSGHELGRILWREKKKKKRKKGDQKEIKDEMKKKERKTNSREMRDVHEGVDKVDETGVFVEEADVRVVLVETREVLINVGMVAGSFFFFFSVCGFFFVLI